LVFDIYYYYYLEIHLLSYPASGLGMPTNTSKTQENTKDMTLGFAPIITHTAATPQGSPNATLEPNRSFLSTPLSLSIQAASLCSIDQSLV
jgi:hypothetical protein